MSNIQSNAYNFPEHISSGVDPRTGSFSVQINMGKYISHKGRGVVIPLTLNYSAMSFSDQGFGRGFSFPVSHFDKTTNTLSLSTGQSFQILWDETMQEYIIPYRKLKDIRVLYVDQTQELLVLFKDGRNEYLDYNTGISKRVVSAQGLSVKFDFAYYLGRYLLWHIYDDDDNEVEIDWWTDEFETRVTHTINGEKFQSFRFVKQGLDKALKYFYMDGLSEFTKFEYQEFPESNTKMITRLTHPSGLIEDMKYLNAHRLPEGAPILYMPYVYQHIRHPGLNQETQITEYIFSDRNYLGFGSDRLWLPNVDNLFYSPNDFRYTSKEIINGSKITIREYNKYHLLEEASYYEADTLLKKEDNIYYADLSLGIEQQPAQYSLLKEQFITYFYNKKTRTISLKTEYDEYANKTKEIAADGSITEYIFYPKEGEIGFCPPDPNGMVSLIKNEIFFPNNSKYLSRKNTTLYEKMDRFESTPKASEYFIITVEVIMHTGVRILTKYFNDFIDKNTYGRINKEIQNINNYISTTEFEYLFTSVDYTKNTVVKTHDNLTSTSSETYEYHFHNIIQQINIEGQVTQIKYDNLGREIERIAHPNNPEYKAINSTQYNISPDNNWIKQTDVNGNIKQLNINNAGNLVQTLMKLKSSGDYLISSQKYYDAFGLMSKEQEYDYINGQLKIISTMYWYDTNGQPRRISHPDGRVEVIEQNPVELTVTHTQVNLLKEVTIYDLSQLEIEKYTYDSSEELLAKTLTFYDGYGNSIQVTDINNNSIYTSYDKFDRALTVTRYIDNTPIVETFGYAPFSSADIPNRIFVDDVEIGKREFDGLLRPFKEVSAGVTHLYEYQGGSSLPVKMIMPRGEVVHIIYDPYLRLPIEKKVEGIPSLNSTYTYDKKTGYIIENENQSSKNIFEYDELLRTTKETIDSKDGNILSTESLFSLGGRLLWEKDYKDNIKKIRFDTLLRPNQIIQELAGINQNKPKYTIDISYDKFSRPISFNVKKPHDEKVSLDITLNSVGAEIFREFKVNGQPKYKIIQSYNNALLLKSKFFFQSDDSDSYEYVSDENYSYDELYRLMSYECNGGNYPIDDYGNQIEAQEFLHDKYGNIVQVQSQFILESFGYTIREENIQKFFYNDKIPVRLGEIQNTHSSYPPRILFYYDAAGNLVNDEHDKWYRYDALGQLDAVISRQHEYLSKYTYNANGALVSQKYSDNDVSYFYYKNNNLLNEVNNDSYSSYLDLAPGLVDRLVKTNSEELEQLLFGDSQDTVFSTFTENISPTYKLINYTPYGESNEKK